MLNEVGSGGTLSSLFTILSLFTENVHLAWPEPDADMDPGELIEAELAMNMNMGPDTDGTGTRPSDILGRARANSEISQLDLSPSAMAFAPLSSASPPTSRSRSRSQSHSPSPSLSPSPSMSFTPPASSTHPAPTQDRTTDADRRTREFVARNFTSLSSASISSQASTVLGGSSGRPTPPNFSSHSSRFGAPGINTRTGVSFGGAGQIPAQGQSNQRQGTAGLENVGGSIARASVDTTLAVIPAGK